MGEAPLSSAEVVTPSAEVETPPEMRADQIRALRERHWLGSALVDTTVMGVPAGSPAAIRHWGRLRADEARDEHFHHSENAALPSDARGR